MQLIMTEPGKRMHPHKFTLWVAVGSIVMMFAGLTSAYIIKRNQANWTTFDLPVTFWYSTGVLLLSSLTLILSRKAFELREMLKYRRLLMLTVVLGITFVILQIMGFREMWAAGLTLTKNASLSFLYVLVGLHAVHVAGGVIALMVMIVRGFSIKTRNYSRVPVELMNTYWHFVDFLWIYLLVFFMVIR